jgi:glucose/arabinose dehydrogenase
VQDTDEDGRADRTKEFATGFNAIQGLAWHGRDLWIANAPDLTVVRDRDGDDEADEYVKVYTDLGNLEHGLHGLNWAPDGKLYMSKGNSKGLNQPGRYAPKAFRDLWGLKAPADVPDIPAAVTSGKNDYRHAYHDPTDDWGLDGGVLRCDDGGKNLEIIARGFRGTSRSTAASTGSGPTTIRRRAIASSCRSSGLTSVGIIRGAAIGGLNLMHHPLR